jgi:SAM-dependent methyltransferase/F0F1-type ATP synthase membrane subunit b/b'
VSGATRPESPGTASAVAAEGRLAAALRAVLGFLAGPVVRPLRRQLDELRRHAETRVDQATGEIADLRGAFLATRGEIEQERIRGAEIVARLQAELEALRDRRLPKAESDLAALHADLTALQGEVEGVRDRRLPRVEEELGRHHAALTAVQTLAEELRDHRLPALSGRLDALVERLHEEIAATASLAERLAAGEGLRITAPPEIEARIPDAMARASVRFADAFRGAREEILGRVAEYVPLLGGSGPVLDLGCGRGELLEALATAGVEARGVDSDPAMIEACRRLGLAASEGEALETLRAAAPASLGAVTAIHVVEHLPPAAWMGLVAEAARALRPGGVLLIESPNPDSLRVGAGLFWTDPTHRAPVHPDALAFVVKAVGLEVGEVRLLRPFPAEQELARDDLPGPVRELARQLDRWLSGPRDYLLVARKTVSS